MSQKSQTAGLDVQIAEEDLLRADLYAMLARLLAGPPDTATLESASKLGGDGSDLGQGVAALAKVAASAAPSGVEREYNTLFIGLGRGELLPYASYYLTGFLNEKPLARLRGHMAQLGIERNPDVKEPEDHIATLCEMMAGLIRGAYGDPLSLDDQHAFFNTHLATWAGHFFTDLEAAENSVFYAPVGKIGRAFMEIEIEAFRMDT
ncbi:TorD/DmsD family molecular chaperone [Kangsaoukella pontilimi]|uniref:TorD/DmsD family molecular chaperone n=1 Tax=Kangsaoukella pontilimi TaxID=2691042 RepID=UPI0029CA446E|nr:molecular chaperone TorD family protein [Kangsaoukella pontilimi]